MDVRTNASTLLTGVSAIAVGARHACALISSDGSVRCWGSNTANNGQGVGQLGDGSGAQQNYAVTVKAVGGAVNSTLTGIASIAAGGYHTCAVTTSGGARCWGKGGEGQLGNNTSSFSTTPVSVHTSVGNTTAISGIASMSATDIVTCAVTTTGGAKCWGYANNGQLGDGTTTGNVQSGANYWQNAPKDVRVLAGGAALTGVSTIDTGVNHTCARMTSGGAMCWGGGGSGQLGIGANSSSTVPVNHLSAMSAEAKKTMLR